jgi:hypothetical protein
MFKTIQRSLKMLQSSLRKCDVMERSFITWKHYNTIVAVNDRLGIISSPNPNI